MGVGQELIHPYTNVGTFDDLHRNLRASQSKLLTKKDSSGEKKAGRKVGEMSIDNSVLAEKSKGIRAVTAGEQ